MLIGNDLVDLRERGASRKSKDERFVRRVFAPVEIEWILGARQPDRVLWMFWAAKEAAFKLVLKCWPGTPFAHRAFEVHPASPTEVMRSVGPTSEQAGTVCVPRPLSPNESSLPVRWDHAETFVHCLAAPDPCVFEAARTAVTRMDPGQTAEPPHGWTTRELRSIRSDPSRQVRILAKRLAQDAGLGDVEIVRCPEGRRMGPPVLYAAGSSEPLQGWDLSLSHDGRWAAAALVHTVRDLGTSRPVR